LRIGMKGTKQSNLISFFKRQTSGVLGIGVAFVLSHTSPIISDCLRISQLVSEKMEESWRKVNRRSAW
jgi:hypothetical protein